MIKRNNPGNLRPFSKTQFYQGSKLVPGDGFLTFDTLSNGFRAIVKDAETKKKGGVNTLLEYFQIYAPAADKNNPSKYAQFVAKATGSNLLPSTAQGYLNFVSAIARIEHGINLNTTQIKEAIAGINNALTKTTQQKNKNEISEILILGISAIVISQILKKFF